MNEREPDLSRVQRKKGRNRNKVLNIMIAVVVLLIIIATVAIFSGNKDDKEPDTTEETTNDTIVNDEESEEVEDGGSGGVEEDVVEDDNAVTDDNKSDSNNTSKNENEENVDSSEESDSITRVPSEDDIIAETIVDTAWRPIGTTQTGEHVSLYDGVSDDWYEKKQALAYATGLPQDSMIFLKIKNGGGPQKSIGIVSSRDSSLKYRVYLEWVDGEGWKPVKMDKLTTLDFDY